MGSSTRTGSIEGNQPAENAFSLSVAPLNLVNPTK